MSKAIALTRSVYDAAQRRQIDIASSAIALACAGALILAGQPGPF